jgi:pilus assembly protein CpaD
MRAHSARRRRPISSASAVRLIAASAIGAALSGCAADRVVTGSTPHLTYHQRHPIVLTEGAHTLDVFVTGQAGLDGRQRADVRAFAGEYRRNGQGAILAQVPAGARSEIGAHATLARIRSELAAAGVPDGYVAVSAYPVMDPLVASPVRLSFARLTAKVTSPCGTWPRDLGISDPREGMRNDTYWNFGCAMQSNVAAQVADPVDLVRPRIDGSPDPIRRAQVIDAVRKGQDPSTQWRTESDKINQGVGN